MRYKKNEIFKSIQGEGANLGKEVIFIRFSGCNLNCVWCDTEHVNFKEIDEFEILKEIDRLNCKNIIFTGGEPTIYNLFPLLAVLNEYWVGIETNGTNINNYSNKFDYISVSPKTKIKNLKCNEIRVVNDNLSINDLLYFEKFDIENKFVAVLEKDNYFNLKETIELIGKINENEKVDKKWRLSEQYHKRLKIK
jgi:organic radical activating enzyme